MSPDDLDRIERDAKSEADHTATGLVSAGEIVELVGEVRRHRAGIRAHQEAHAAWSDRREGWEEATFEADYQLWSLLADQETTP